MCSIELKDVCTLREAMRMMGFDFNPDHGQEPNKYLNRGDRLVVKPDPSKRKFCVREDGSFWSHCGGFSLCSFQKVFDSKGPKGEVYYYRGQGGFHVVIDVDRNDSYRTKMIVNESC